VLSLFGQLVRAVYASADVVIAPPPDLVARLSLSPFYTKCVLVEGLPVVGSAKVSDYGLLEAAYLIRKEIGHRPEILGAMAKNGVRFAVMAPTEMTTDIPEHSDLTPRNFWNRRARGLGATTARPAVSCGEENLLCLRGDPYSTENILLHEFAHAVHEMGLHTVDPTFDARLQQAYDSARAEGLWKGTYAMENRMEYLAEGAQSWFDTNRSNDREHGPIDTREKLKAYDPRFAVLLTEIFGDGSWRYVRPDRRAELKTEGLAHLAGFNPNSFAPFVWPENKRGDPPQEIVLAWIDADKLPRASPPAASAPTTIEFVNQRSEVVEIEWIDSSGTPKFYCKLRPGMTHLQNTFAGHIWVISHAGKPLGAVIATTTDSRAEIR
jgi:VHL beta domain